MRQFIPIENLASEGLREDTGSVQKLWSRLENVRRGTTGWRSRQGTRKIGTTLPGTVAPGLPKIVASVNNPASLPIFQELTPTMVGAFGQWAPSGGSSLVTAVDEATPDASDFVFTTVKGNKVSYTFNTLAGTWNSVGVVRIRLSVARHATVNHDLLVYFRIAGVNHLITTKVITSGTGNELVVVESTINPATTSAWTKAEVDVLEVVLEKGSGFTAGLAAEATPSQIELVQFSGGNPNAFYGDGNLASEDGDTGGVEWGAGDQAGIFLLIPPDAAFDGLDTKLRVTTQLKRLGPVVNALTGLTSIQIDSNTVVDIFNNSAPPVTLNANPPTPYADMPDTYQVIEHITSTPQFAADGLLRVRVAGLNFSNDPGFRVSSVRVFRVTDFSPNDSASLQVNWVHGEVAGDGENGVRTTLLLATSKAIMRMTEDLTTYLDITSGVTLSAPESNFWDLTVFQDIAYIVNGKDQIIKLDSPTTISQFSGKPTGRCVAGFAKRLWLGDVTETGPGRKPSRLRWSSIDNTTDWSTTGGNLELDETPGSVVRIRPMVEQSQTLIGVLAAYKTEGIYHIFATGDSNDPFTKKLMDSSSGCVAPGTLKAIAFRDGRERHVFLGQTGGTINLMAWDGAQIQQFGYEAIPILEELANPLALSQCIAEIDQFDNYILVFPKAGESTPSTALVYNFEHKVWSRWELTDVSAMGRWRPNTGDVAMILARSNMFAFELTDSSSTDDLVLASAQQIPAVLETGDLSLGETHSEKVLHRLWMYYLGGDLGTSWQVDVSKDGGANYTATEVLSVSDKALIGTSSVKPTRLQQFDTRVTGRKHRVRFTSADAGGRPQLLQMILEVEQMGERFTSAQETT